MIIYKDIISGDEMFTSTYKTVRNGGLIEIDCHRVTETTALDDKAFGGNASAEESQESAEDSSVTGFDVVIQNRLQEMPAFDKKGYTTYIKGYLKQVKSKLQENGKSEEEISKFEQEAQTAVKGILKNLKNYRFFSGESMNAEGMLALLDYREDGITAFMSFFADGLEEEKV